ncbi:ABC transporter permease [Paracoccus sp. J55]|uniref:ABC transporter permease n=1 Tax=Paracoccus sp. J55 TaxID=935849 RepID=UPI0004BA61FF|nr:ABC transporter permease [Paracoccus sp. J55]
MDSNAPATSVAQDDVAPRRRNQTRYLIGQFLWNMIPPMTFVAIVGLWAVSVKAFQVPSYLLPAPDAVFRLLIAEAPMLWANTKVTLLEILLGFGLTILLAIPLGLVIALSPLAKQVLYPPAMLLQLVPKIAMAPLFLVWFGFGIESKVILTLLMTFFPLLISSISGFQILDTRLLYLTRSMGANTWQTFRYLRVPAALPVIFSGVKTSATIAATAAIVAEFVGANEGLGYVLLRGTSTMNMELTFAVLVILTVIGLAINYAVELTEWALAPWQRKLK